MQLQPVLFHRYKALCFSSVLLFFINPAENIKIGLAKLTGEAEFVINVNAGSNDLFLFRFISFNKLMSAF